jgi:DNA-binding transcriptional MerR regulator
MAGVTDRSELIGTVQVFEPEPGQSYSLEAAAHLAGVSRRTVLLYSNAGLIRPTIDPDYGGLRFSEQAILTMRRGEAMRSSYGMDLAGIQLVFGLLREVEDLREELRFHRGY